MFRKSQNTRKTLLLQFFIKWLWDSAIWSYHKVLWRFCFGHLICFLVSCLLIRFFMFFIVDTPGEKLTTKMLETKNVYILDCHSEIFVWYVKILSKILSLGFSFFLFFSFLFDPSAFYWNRLHYWTTKEEMRKIKDLRCFPPQRTFLKYA